MSFIWPPEAMVAVVGGVARREAGVARWEGGRDRLTAGERGRGGNGVQWNTGAVYRDADRGRGVCRRSRGLPEPKAYAELRKAAMNQGKRIADIAEAIVTAHELMGNG